MALDRTQMRPDIAFIKRRPRRPESVSNASGASTVATGGLNPSQPSGGNSGASGGLNLGGAAHDPRPSTGKISFDRPGRKSSTNTGSVPVQSTPSTGGLSLGSAPASSSPSTGGLSLGRASSEPTPAQGIPAVQQYRGSSLSLKPKMDEDLPKHSVPYFHDNLELSLDYPVVRLDFRQSGIGSLVIEGAQAFAWETQDKKGGLQVSDPENSSEVPPPVFGNRRLVEFYEGKVVMSLRHGKHLRRLVVASHTDDLRIKMYDGSEIFMPSDGGNNVLLISRIGHEFECRMERINDVDINGVFGIKYSQVSSERNRY